MPNEKNESFLKKYSYLAVWISLVLLVLLLIWALTPS